MVSTPGEAPARYTIPPLPAPVGPGEAGVRVRVGADRDDNLYREDPDEGEHAETVGALGLNGWWAREGLSAGLDATLRRYMTDVIQDEQDHLGARAWLRADGKVGADLSWNAVASAIRQLEPGRGNHRDVEQETYWEAPATPGSCADPCSHTFHLAEIALVGEWAASHRLRLRLDHDHWRVQMPAVSGDDAREHALGASLAYEPTESVALVVRAHGRLGSYEEQGWDERWEAAGSAGVLADWGGTEWDLRFGRRHAQVDDLTTEAPWLGRLVVRRSTDSGWAAQFGWQRGAGTVLLDGFGERLYVGGLSREVSFDLAAIQLSGPLGPVQATFGATRWQLALGGFNDDRRLIDFLQVAGRELEGREEIRWRYGVQLDWPIAAGFGVAAHAALEQLEGEHGVRIHGVEDFVAYRRSVFGLDLYWSGASSSPSPSPSPDADKPGVMTSGM